MKSVIYSIYSHKNTVIKEIKKKRNRYDLNSYTKVRKLHSSQRYIGIMHP